MIKTVLIILGILLVLVLAACLALTAFSMGTHPQSMEQARAWQEAHYDLSWYDPLEKEDFTVTATDGYILHVQRLIGKAAADRCVIISHGYTDNRFGALKYAKNYLDMGFDVIVYDLRGHGKNRRTACTYSAKERLDLDCLIRLVRAQYPQYRVLGLHGESLGAATTAACLEKKPPVDFAVADCGFSAIEDVLRGSLKKMHVPVCLLRLTSLIAKIRTGYSYRQMRPVDCLADNTVPMLFFHGTEDELIAPRHSEAMAGATKGKSVLCLIPGAPHALSVLTAPKVYREQLQVFLHGIGVI